MANLLSRSIITPKPESSAPVHDEVEHNIIQLLHKPLQETVSLSELQDASDADPALSLVASYIRNGWPNNVPDNLSAYFRVRLCAVVPSVLWARVLAMVHEGHFGIVRLKQRCWDLVWWPGIDIDIETLVRDRLPAFSAARPGPQPLPHPCRTWTGHPNPGSICNSTSVVSYTTSVAHHSATPPMIYFGDLRPPLQLAGGGSSRYSNGWGTD